MLLYFARSSMLIIWLVLLLNLFKPWPAPMHLLLYIALIFMVVMHSLKLLILRTLLAPQNRSLTWGQLVRLFIFGVIELVVWQKTLAQPSIAKPTRQSK